MNRKPIPYARQSISEADIQAVVEVLRSDWLTQGPVIERFERAVAGHCGATYAVAVNSGTSALHIACLAAGLGPGDTLWTTPNTFVASANCGLYCGASIDFVDIDPGTYNLSPDELERKLDHAAKDGTLPKVLIPVHFSGQSCTMDRITELAGRYGIAVIEDACHATGGSYQGSRIGSCAFSAMTVFSFHPVKIITTGEGGMVLTNRKDLYEKLIRLRSHGIIRDPAHMEGESHGPWYYQQQDLGFNYRITDMQAALGMSQMKRIDEFVRRRSVLARQYDEGLRGLPLTLPSRHPDAGSAHHLYVVRVPAVSGRTRAELFTGLREAGILANVHYIPVHLQPLYQRRGFHAGDFPHAEQYYREAISLPMYFGLTDDEQAYVIGTLRKLLS
ncbi:MAG: UDP-4-amino-4,6-dideoxy-N-acetyl-beta-L-altrosamine transaminase [Nitrospirota bacterium]